MLGPAIGRLLVVAIAFAAWAGLGGGAMAANATIEPAGSIRLASLGKVSFTFSGLTIRCNYTLRGTLSRGPIELTRGRTLGSIAEMLFSECEGGIWNATLHLPWSITVESIRGTVPSAITGLLVTLPRFGISVGNFGGMFVNCLYEGPLALEVAINAVAGTREPWRYTTGLVTVRGRMPLISGSVCPAEGSWVGTLDLTPTQSLSVR